MKSLLSLFLGILLLISLSGCDSPVETRASSPAIPVPLLPYNGSYNIVLTPLFKWQNNANRLHVSEHASFSTLKVNAQVTGTQYQLGENEVLDPKKLYYWRVGVTSGETTLWSLQIFSFATQ